MKKKSKLFGVQPKQSRAKEEFDENMKAILADASEISDQLKYMGIDPSSVKAVCVTSDNNGDQKAYTVDLTNLTTKPRQLSDAELDLLSGQADIDGEEIDCACSSCPRNQQTLNESSEHGRRFPLSLGEYSLLRNIKS
ncbi:MAG: hypothetical protein NC310_09040 [Roseburia sp.]|nr:hypothetical protein [Roseburia sp.]